MDLFFVKNVFQKGKGNIGMQEPKFFIKISENGRSMHIFKKRTKKAHVVQGGPGNCFCEPEIMTFNKEGYPKRGYVHQPLKMSEVLQYGDR